MAYYPNYPKADYARPHKSQGNLSDDVVLDKAVDLLLRNQLVMQSLTSPKTEEKKITNPIALDEHHRYGSDVDILRATFTKSPEELDKEKFQLLLATRALHRRIMWCCETIPKVEKYVLGSSLRECSLNLLKFAICIKKKYYRRNLLENMDVELDCLREYFYHASADYPKWCTAKMLQLAYTDINAVGALVGGLLKSTVAGG